MGLSYLCKCGILTRDNLSPILAQKMYHKIVLSNEKVALKAFLALL